MATADLPAAGELEQLASVHAASPSAHRQGVLQPYTQRRPPQRATGIAAAKIRRVRKPAVEPWEQEGLSKADARQKLMDEMSKRSSARVDLGAIMLAERTLSWIARLPLGSKFAAEEAARREYELVKPQALKGFGAQSAALAADLQSWRQELASVSILEMWNLIRRQASLDKMLARPISLCRAVYVKKPLVGLLAVSLDPEAFDAPTTASCLIGLVQSLPDNDKPAVLQSVRFSSLIDKAQLHWGSFKSWEREQTLDALAGQQQKPQPISPGRAGAGLAQVRRGAATPSARAAIPPVRASGAA